MNNNRTLLLVLFILITAGVVAGFGYIVSQNKNTTPTSATQTTGSSATANTLTQTATAELALGGQQAQVTPGQLDVSVQLSSDDLVNGAEVTVHYNPQEVSFVQAKPGSYFGSPVEVYKNVNETTGTVVYAVGTLSATSGNSPVVVFSFAPLGGATSANIELDSSSVVSLKGGREVKLSLPMTQTYSILN